MLEMLDKKETFTDRIFLAFVYIMLLFSLVTVLYPLLYILSSSVSSPTAIVAGKVWLLPVEPTVLGYRLIMKDPQIMTGFINSLFYTAAGTLFNVFMTVIAAYPLSRKDLAGRGPLMFLFTFTMLFGGGMIPNYLLIKSLGLIDTKWVMIIPGALGVWNLIVTRTYFIGNVPEELLEASQLDGCDDMTFLSRVVIPLSKPIIAVLVLLYAVGHWNGFFSALIYLNSPRHFPLQLILRNILMQNTADPSLTSLVYNDILRQNVGELLKFSLIVFATFPVLMLYPFIQKYFVKGIMIGSLKG